MDTKSYYRLFSKFLDIYKWFWIANATTLGFLYSAAISATNTGRIDGFEELFNYAIKPFIFLSLGIFLNALYYALNPFKTKQDNKKIDIKTTTYYGNLFTAGVYSFIVLSPMILALVYPVALLIHRNEMFEMLRTTLP